MNDHTRVDVKAFIDQRSMSSTQWLLLVLCFLIVAVDGMDAAVAVLKARAAAESPPLANSQLARA